MTHYLDHAATTPMRPGAIRAWEDAARLVGNPSSLHADGRHARRIVEESRERMADLLHVPATDIVFTSGGTESDNLAIEGLARGRRAVNPQWTTILTSSIEHHAVLDCAYHLVNEGFTVVELPVTSEGIVDVEQATRLIEDHASTACVVSCMSVNNEIGTIQPVAELATACRALGIPFHCDAVQGFPDVDSVPVRPTALTLSAHKIGGPIGIGALVVDRGAGIVPISFGGGQERRLRSGTVSTPLVASFAEAIAESRNPEESAMISELGTHLESSLTSIDAHIVGTNRVKNIVYALFPHCESESLLMLLDADGISVSTGSACTSGVAQPSHVLMATGCSESEARSGLRFSLGWTSTCDDIDALMDALPDAIDRARRN